MSNNCRRLNPKFIASSPVSPQVVTALWRASTKAAGRQWLFRNEDNVFNPIIDQNEDKVDKDKVDIAIRSLSRFMSLWNGMSPTLPYCLAMCTLLLD